MASERRKSYIATRTEKAVASRRVFRYLAGVTLVLGFACGFVVTLVDREDFPTLGDGVWWAIVTLGTVGYGDIVPGNGWGRLIGSVVIVLGVTFIAFLTATVTSAFVSADERERLEQEEQRRKAAEAELRGLLHEIRGRLDAIESKLG